jgi:hypothetical protein
MWDWLSQKEHAAANSSAVTTSAVSVSRAANAPAWATALEFLLAHR